MFLPMWILAIIRTESWSKVERGDQEGYSSRPNEERIMEVEIHTGLHLLAEQYSLASARGKRAFGPIPCSLPGFSNSSGLLKG
jgi:hypothetical protein